MKTILKHPLVFLKVTIFLIFLLILQIILSYSFIYRTSLKEVESSLTQLSLRIEKDLRFVDGKWDTRQYNADPLTPYPNGSSGFLNPLYILTNEGFLIERSQPIKGLLDTSDFKHLIQFKEPQTIDTVTNEKWRIYSKPVVFNGNVIGVIVVSYYIPRDELNIAKVDGKLEESIRIIESALIIKNNEISVSKLDIRNIHYEFSFEVVDRFNNVLANNGRVPTFVDASYFSKSLNEKSVRIITDGKSQEKFIVVSHIMKGGAGEPIGIILAGQSISVISKTLQNVTVFTLLITMGLIIPLLFYMGRMLNSDIALLLTDSGEDTFSKIKKITFDKKNSHILIDDIFIEIPYASNQYYICEALLLHPTKKWEYDELLERIGDFGSESVNTRKVYDAVLAVNKKVGVRLIEYKNKVFTINPSLHSIVQKINSR